MSIELDSECYSGQLWERLREFAQKHNIVLITPRAATLPLDRLDDTLIGAVARDWPIEIVSTEKVELKILKKRPVDIKNYSFIFSSERWKL